MNVGDLYNAYLQLSSADRQRFQALLENAQTPARSKRENWDRAQMVDEQVLYDLIWAEMNRWTGARMMKLSTLKTKVPTIMPLLKETWDWLLKGDMKIQRPVKMALAKIAAEAVVVDTRTRWNVPVTADEHANMVRRIAQSVENQYPGYRASGLLVKLAVAVARGALRKSDEDPLTHQE